LGTDKGNLLKPPSLTPSLTGSLAATGSNRAPTSVESRRDEGGDVAAAPAFALVIGISRYEDGCDPSLQPGDDQFRDLRFAAKDAGEFAEFLKKDPRFKGNIRLLVDDKANRVDIVDHFDQLRELSQRSGTKDPLIIVFFSGHGMMDDAGRHYLLPWDAKRKKLRATALRTRTSATVCMSWDQPEWWCSLMRAILETWRALE